ncbi:MAG: hypothetical protein E6Q86_07925 [Tolumonas sp.]|nr:MAG: hypothetical protein E6Q86_07925 [Tolumonas sp.]
MTRSVKFLFILTFLALSAFYLYVLYLAKHPDVSMAYRMYYLEKKTRIWDRNQSLAYIPGVLMDLTNERERCPYLSREGWDIPEKDGSGSLFSGAGGLYFTLHREPGVLKFEGTLTAKKADTELTIKVSDKFSKTVKFNDAGVQTFELTLPSGLFIADPAEANYLSLQSNNPIMFKSFKLSHAG